MHLKLTGGDATILRLEKINYGLGQALSKTTAAPPSSTAALVQCKKSNSLGGPGAAPPPPTGITEVDYLYKNTPSTETLNCQG